MTHLSWLSSTILADSHLLPFLPASLLFVIFFPRSALFIHLFFRLSHICLHFCSNPRLFLVSFVFVVLQNVIRSTMPINDEMAHQLYVLQVLTFNLLEDRMMTKMDPQDQVGAEKLKVLHRFCFAFDVPVIEWLTGEVQLHLVSVVFVTMCCFCKRDIFIGFWSAVVF